MNIYNLDGKKYTSKELSELSGINYETIKNRLKRGWSVEEAIGRVKRIPSRVKTYELDGKKYTMKELSEMSGIKIITIRRRLKYGWSIKDAIKKPIKTYDKTYELDGKKYTMKELSELSGMQYDKIKNRLTGNWTVEEAIDRVPRFSNSDNFKPIIVNDRIKVLRYSYTNNNMQYFECVDLINNKALIMSKEELISLYKKGDVI